MHEVTLSNEITEYISAGDFYRLLSSPSLLESEIEFKPMKKNSYFEEV